MPNGIQSFDPKTHTFEQSVSAKVKRFLADKCIRRICYGLYECGPIAGYNTRTYTIKEEFGKTICNCQGFHKRGDCSHCQAVRIFRQSAESEKEKQLQLNLA